MPFGFAPDPKNPGWFVRTAREVELFIDQFGELRVTVIDAQRSRLRVVPMPHHRNVNGTVHGGFILAFADQALFIGPAIAGIEGMHGASTVDLTTQFMGPLDASRPVDAVVEVMRETRRMTFLRGTLEQDGKAAVSFVGTVRKQPAAA